MTRSRIAFAHVLRGAAASAVVLSHLTYLIWHKPDIIGELIAYPAVPGLIQGTTFVPITDFGLSYFWGYLGVGLFFLISGFVIPFSVASLSRAGFAVARIFRIWPTYLVGLAIAVACIAFNSALSGNPFPFSVGEILTSALIVPRWPTLTRSIDGIVWTLEIEIFFYTFCLLTMNLLRSFDRQIFLLALVAAPLAYLVGSQTQALIGVGMPIYALAHWSSAVLPFVCFMLCGTACYYHYRGRLNATRLIGLHAVLLVAFIISLRVGVLATPDWSAPLCYLAAYAAFMICYLARRKFGALPGPIHRFAYWMADISFPLYAVHGVLGYTILVHAVEIGVPSWVAVAIALAVVFAVAAVVHRTVELPTHAYGKALALKLTPAREPHRQDAPDAMSRSYMEMTSPAGPNAMIRPSRR